MAKVGLWLKGAKGKLAGTVLSTSRGVTTVRENVTPSNPNTESQTLQRARFKLISQIAAAVSDAIAIPYSNGLTPRNRFVALNMGTVTAVRGIRYSAGQAPENYVEASCVLSNLQLTDSTRGLAGVNASREDGVSKVYLDNTSQNANLSHVIYNIFVKNRENTLTFVKSVTGQKGNDYTFTASVALPEDGDIVILAYGVRIVNEKAFAKYGNIIVESGIDFAQLIATNKMAATDIQLTRTRGVELPMGATHTLVIPDGYYGVYFSSRPKDGCTITARVLNEQGIAEEEYTESFACKKGKRILFVVKPNTGYRLKNRIEFYQGEAIERGIESWDEDEFTLVADNNIDFAMLCEEDYGEMVAMAKKTDVPSEYIDNVVGVNSLDQNGVLVRQGSSVNLVARSSALNGTYKFKGWTLPRDTTPTDEEYLNIGTSYRVTAGKETDGIQRWEYFAWYEPVNQ